MNKKKILLTPADKERLHKNVALFMQQSAGKDSPRIQQLARLLETAELREPDAMPEEVVTMHSVVSLVATDHENRQEYRLVYPSQSDAFERKISVLSAMGLALLGSRVGDDIEWEGPRGMRRYRLEAILEQGCRTPQHA